MPILRVIWLMGQPPQAPVSFTLTTPSSVTSTSSTLPPSRMQGGADLLQGLFHLFFQLAFPM